MLSDAYAASAFLRACGKSWAEALYTSTCSVVGAQLRFPWKNAKIGLESTGAANDDGSKEFVQLCAARTLPNTTVGEGESGAG